MGTFKKFNFFCIIIVVAACIIPVIFFLINMLNAQKSVEVSFSKKKLYRPSETTITFLSVYNKKTSNVSVDYDTNYSNFISISNFNENEMRWTINYNNAVAESTNIIFNVIVENQNFQQTLTLQNNITISDEEVYDYIYDRTFSIGSFANFGWTKGTGWILNKTDSNEKYEYWLATNWHVKCGFDSLNGTKKYSFNRGTDGVKEYYSFSNFIWEQETNFMKNNNPLNAIDFFVAKVNFGDLQPSETKDKLDFLNVCYEQNSNINLFEQIDDLSTNLGDEYICGYPSANYNNKVAHWEEHKLNERQIFSDQSEVTHWINDSNSILDASLQYVFQPNYPNWWLSGGASGSMVVALNNEKTLIYIRAIYWGLFEDTISRTFFSTSILWSSYNGGYNYIANYL
ncbi:MAG: DUF31 family protein [Mycoplasmataceae bacterium]|nr:DUF31 family protein [Mycoplasmataceae bacterium]